MPFALIPNQKERSHGILFPEIVPSSAYGFGFQNLGYYVPINDRLQTSVYANLYSRGSWGLRNDLDYAKRYAYTGRLSLGFQQYRTGFPDDNTNNKTTVIWTHRKARKSNPKPTGLMMHISGKVDGLRKGTIFLQKVVDSALVDIDSIIINGNPEFNFKTKIESPEIYYLYLNKDDGDTLNDRVMFFAEKGEIIINTLLKTFESSAKVSGSENQELLQEYRKISRQFNAKNLDYIKAYINLSLIHI